MHLAWLSLGHDSIELVGAVMGKRTRTVEI